MIVVPARKTLQNRSKFQKFFPLALALFSLAVLNSGSASAQYLKSTPNRGMVSIAALPGATKILDTGDDAYGNTTLPFDFVFFGTTYPSGTQLLAASNGYLAFDSALAPNSDFTNDPLPTAGTPDSIIALFWDDLNLSNGGDIFAFVAGTAPNRVMFIEWNAVVGFSGGGTYTGQILLVEGSNNIELRYDNNTLFRSAASTTIGIEDPTGTLAFGGPDTTNTIDVTPLTNFRFEPFVVQGIDLTTGNPTPNLSPTQIAAGGTISLERTIRNQGNMAAGGFTVTYYLSADNIINTNDVVLSSENITGLGPQLSDGPSLISLNIPGSLTSAVYFIGFIIDSTNAVTEANETNNTSPAIGFFVGTGTPDLVAQSITTTATNFTPGGNITYTRTIANTSASASPPVRIEVYLSDNTTISRTDVLIEDFTFTSGFAANSSDMTTVTVPIPTTANASAYFLGILVDGDNDILETSETNNTVVSASSLAFMAPPDVDLTADSIALAAGQSSTVAPGATFMVTRSISNIGFSAAGAFQARVVLSLDQTVDASDPVVFVENFPGLAANSTDQITVTAQAPAAAATYFLILDVDFMRQQIELDDTNNRATGPVLVTVGTGGGGGGIDLLATALTATPSSLMGGQNLNITRNISNAGGQSSGLIELVTVFSTDPAIDLTDAILDFSFLSSLNGGQNTGSVTISSTLPANTLPGTYFVGLILDPANSITETNETNNTRATASAITIVPRTGDINGDGRVSVLDVQATVNQVVQLTARTPAADFNQDGFFDILDVQTAINLAMGATP